VDFGFLAQPAMSGGGTYVDWVISGIKWTVLVSLCAWVIAFTLGSVLGVLRTTSIAPLRNLAAGYVELFRNIPLLVHMFIWYFVIPEIVPDNLGTWMKAGMPMPEFWSAVLALGFYTASRVAEQVRSGIQSIPRGQVNAGLATGLTMTQVYRHVLLPMAYRIVVPPLTSEFLTIFKNSSVALTIGVLELTAQARQISEYTYRTFEIFTVATVVYILITLAVTLLMRVVEQKVRVPGYIGSANK
jgi:glutamate/aspartate transport system permease protein